MMVPCVAVLLALMIQASNAHYYRNHVIVGRGVQPLATAASLRACVDTCGDTCSAVSFSNKYKYCLKTTCGNVNLRSAQNTDWETVVVTKAAIAGETLPKATHEWGLTDRCGAGSVGTYNAPGFVVTGTSYSNQQSVLFGKALTFPYNNGVSSAIAKTWPHSSVSQYLDLDTSFSVAFNVYFNAIPAHACFFEFRNASDDWSWHFWLWPDAKTPFANLINSAGTSQGMWATKTFLANTWYHWAYVYEASASILEIFVDGVSIGTQVMGHYAKKAADRIAIGGRPKDAIGFFNGSVYCVSSFNEALTPAHVLEHKRSCINGRVRIETTPLKN